jgi:hypothetical protein
MLFGATCTRAYETPHEWGYLTLGQHPTSSRFCFYDGEGIPPRDNSRYAVFGETLYSPCDGEVFDMVDNWPNEVPFIGKAPYNVGNQMVLKTGDYYVLMGQFQKWSITVKIGDRITKGQLKNTLFFK